LHCVLADRFKKPVLDCSSLQDVDGFMKIELAGIAKERGMPRWD
jgi:hypothetical protein